MPLLSLHAVDVVFVLLKVGTFPISVDKGGKTGGPPGEVNTCGLGRLVLILQDVNVE